MSSFHTPQDISHFVGQAETESFESYGDPENFKFKDDEIPLESHNLKLNQDHTEINHPEFEDDPVDYRIDSTVEKKIDFGSNNNQECHKSNQDMHEMQKSSSGNKNPSNQIHASEEYPFQKVDQIMDPEIDPSIRPPYSKYPDHPNYLNHLNYPNVSGTPIKHKNTSMPTNYGNVNRPELSQSSYSQYESFMSPSSHHPNPKIPLHNIRSSMDIYRNTMDTPLNNTMDNAINNQETSAGGDVSREFIKDPIYPQRTFTDKPALPTGASFKRKLFQPSSHNQSSHFENRYNVNMNHEVSRNENIPSQRLQRTSNDSAVEIEKEPFNKNPSKSIHESNEHYAFKSLEDNQKEEILDVNSQFNDLKKIEKYRKQLDANHEKMDSISKFYSEDKLVSENNSLKQNIELLNIRIKSLENIISIQNDEIQKKENEQEYSHWSSKSHSDPTLTEKWRQKVYALLVQKHVLEKEAKEIKQENLSNLKKAAKANDALMYKYKVSVQKYSDVQAKLDIKKKQCKLLKEDNARTYNREQMLKRHIESQNSQIQKSKAALSQYLNSNYAKIESKLNSESSLLNSFTKRIEFSEGRIEMIKNVMNKQRQKFSERIAQLESELNQEVSRNKELTQSLSQLKPVEELSKEMEREITQLKKERTYLLEKNERDLELQRNKDQLIIKELQQKLDDEIHQVMKLRSQLNTSCDDYAQLQDNYNNLRLDLHKSQDELHQKIDEVNHLKESYQKQAEHMNEKIQERVENAIGQTTEELSIVKKELEMMTDERNDLVNQVSSFREQMESMTSKHQAEIRRLQEYFDLKMHAKNTEISTLEQECKALMESNRKLGGVMNFSVPPILAPSSSILGRPPTDPIQYPEKYPHSISQRRTSSLEVSNAPPHRSVPVRHDESRPLIDQIRFDTSHSLLDPATLPQPRRLSANDSILTQLDTVENLVESLLKDD